uniref:Putative secreted protein n=1 Tax=Anopheles darlingi TaxID=43151 RepID=A0A2M4D3R8_ANODA
MRVSFGCVCVCVCLSRYGADKKVNHRIFGVSKCAAPGAAGLATVPGNQTNPRPTYQRQRPLPPERGSVGMEGSHL